MLTLSRRDYFSFSSAFGEPLEQLYVYSVITAMFTPSPIHESSDRTHSVNAFHKCWVASTADNNLTVDLGTRSRTDPFQRWLHTYLRAFRYWRLLRKARSNSKGLQSVAVRQQRWSYQNTILIAEVIGRETTAALTAVFIIAPLAIMSHKSSKNIQLIVALVVMHYCLIFPCVALPEGVELRDDGSICWVRCCSFSVCFQCSCKRRAMIIGLWIAVLLGDRSVIDQFSKV